MDKAKSRWSWLPQFMPGVAARLRAKRRELGDAHVNLCWQRGVVECQPGWFFAREGAISVGLPDADWTAILYAQPPGARPVVLMLATPDKVAHGAH